MDKQRSSHASESIIRQLDDYRPICTFDIIFLLQSCYFFSINKQKIHNQHPQLFQMASLAVSKCILNLKIKRIAVIGCKMEQIYVQKWQIHYQTIMTNMCKLGYRCFRVIFIFFSKKYFKQQSMLFLTYTHSSKQQQCRIELKSAQYLSVWRPPSPPTQFYCPRSEQTLYLPNSFSTPPQKQ